MLASDLLFLVIALHSFMRHIHPCALFIYARHSFLCYIAFINPFPCISYICATFIYTSHLSTHFIHLCTRFTYALRSFFSFHVSTTYVLHLFMRRSCVALIHASPLFTNCTHLCFVLTYASHSSRKQKQLQPKRQKIKRQKGS